MPAQKKIDFFPFALSVAICVALCGCNQPKEFDIGMSQHQAVFPAHPSQGDRWVRLADGLSGLGDAQGDGTATFRDIVGDGERAAAFVYTNGTDAFFRIRVDGEPDPGGVLDNGSAWGVLIDTDNDTTEFEYLALLDAIGGNVLLLQNTDLGAGTGEVFEDTDFSAAIDTGANGNARVVNGGIDFPVGTPDRDHFVEFAIPVAEFAAEGFTFHSSLQFVAGTSTVSNAINDDVTVATVATTPTGQRIDSDGDGVPDVTDLDDDNDGIPDLDEYDGIDPTGDNDVDTIQNQFDADDRGDGTANGCTDVDVDGLCDVFSTLFDDDGDRVPNHIDLDSDNDAIPDFFEAGHGAAEEGTSGQVAGPFGANGLADSVETAADSGTLNYGPLDTDNDGDLDAIDLDSDGDGTFDIAEMTSLAFLDQNANGRQNNLQDGDRDGLRDPIDNNETTYGGRAISSNPEQNALDDPDTDGIPAAYDPDDDGGAGVAGDSDADGVDDDDECVGGWPCTDTDLNGVPDYMTNAATTDSDGDGVNDDTDPAPGDDSICGDSDLDTCDDCSVANTFSPNNDGTDTDGDGACDAGDADDDDDGLSDTDEASISSDPLDADSDDDGVLDGDEVNPTADSDGDNLVNALDPDSDNDGVLDGTEAGVTTPDTDTNLGANNFVADADPATTTNPVEADTDGDGRSDGEEDANQNGRVDEGETDPNVADGGVMDCPFGNDEVPDTTDTDGDGIVDACDPDADGDGIIDTVGISGTGCSSSGGASGTVAALFALALLALFRRKSRLLARAVGGAIALLLVLSTSQAQAQTSTDFTLERFRLSTDSNGILDVEWAGVPKHLQLDVGLWVGYADDPLILYRELSGDRNRSGAIISDRLGGALVASLGIGERAQLGFELPLTIDQNAETRGLVSGLDSPTEFGLGDLRLVPKLAVARQKEHGVNIAVVAGLSVPTNTDEDFMGEDEVVWMPELLVGRSFDNGLRLGLNVGYRSRPTQELVDLMVDDEIYGHVGAAFRFDGVGGPPLEIGVTFAAATASEDVFDKFNSDYTEVKGGIAYYIGRFQAFAAGGIGTTDGFGAPDWRALGGIRIATSGVEDEPERIIVEQPKDSDGDGLVDSKDKCPREPETVNQHQDEDGCPDTLPDGDQDGIVDREDQCPVEPEDMDGFEDENGCPDDDNDGDGIADADDKCRDEPGVPAMQGCPEPDRDGDGVADRVDNCPDEAGKPEFQGCNKEQLVQIGDTKIEIKEVVYFATNKAVIQRRSYALLDNVADVLKGHPEITKIEIGGHSDDRGNDRYNKRLSQRRADAVAKYLVQAGVDVGRLIALGYGEEEPIADNSTKEGRSTNRRVEFKILARTDREPTNSDGAEEPEETPEEQPEQD